jgi:hypothetical protein
MPCAGVTHSGHALPCRAGEAVGYKAPKLHFFYHLRATGGIACAPTPYPWPIALRFSQCHNQFSGQLAAGRTLWVRRFLEGGPAGQETFLR